MNSLNLNFNHPKIVIEYMINQNLIIDYNVYLKVLKNKIKLIFSFNLPELCKYKIANYFLISKCKEDYDFIKLSLYSKYKDNINYREFKILNYNYYFDINKENEIEHPLFALELERLKNIRL